MTLASAPEEDPRRLRLLGAAIGVFLRFGFRKTSMDEVARAADVSRQGLYLHFASKEELFRAALRHLLEGSLRAAKAALADGSLPLEARLVRAFDAWVGRYVGSIGPGASDLGEVAGALGGELMAEHEARFLDSIARALRRSGVVAAYKPASLTSRQLADTLYATARGLKHASADREHFIKGMTVAAKAMCLPIGEPS